MIYQMITYFYYTIVCKKCEPFLFTPNQDIIFVSDTLFVRITGKLRVERGV